MVNSQSSRCSMKLHIVVMPQRGRFQGFGTQRPDWKKKKKLCYRTLFPLMRWQQDGEEKAVERDTSTQTPAPGIRLMESRITTVRFRTGKTLGTWITDAGPCWMTNQMQPCGTFSFFF